MTKAKKNRFVMNILLVCMLLAAALIAASLSAHALDGLEAGGLVKSSGGAVLRSSASTKSTKLAVLKQNSPVVIKKEVFTTKKKTGSTKKWYYVTTGAGDGYMRSDLVKVISYGAADGKTTKKVKYRAGAGSKMKKKGTLKKKKSFTIVLEAKAKGSSKRWYKIRKGSKYYYLSSSGTKISNLRSGTAALASINDPDAVVQSAAALSVVNGACAWAVDIAANDNFHYGKKPNSQHNGCYFCGTQMLTGGRSKAGVEMYEFSYCCNPFVHAAFAHGGNEQTMLQVCKRGSSYDYHLGRGYDTSPLFAKLGVPAMGQLKKGDVLCTDNHVMLYLGGGRIVEATGGDDNVPYSAKWNNSIRVCDLSSSTYAKVHGVYRYIGDGR